MILYIQKTKSCKVNKVFFFLIRERTLEDIGIAFG